MSIKTSKKLEKNLNEGKFGVGEWHVSRKKKQMLFVCLVYMYLYFCAS